MAIVQRKVSLYVMQFHQQRHAKSQESHDFQKFFRQNHYVEAALNIRLMPDYDVYQYLCYQLYLKIELVNSPLSAAITSN